MQIKGLHVEGINKKIPKSKISMTPTKSLEISINLLTQVADLGTSGF